MICTAWILPQISLAQPCAGDLERRAFGGSSKAQFQLAYCYERSGVTGDLSKAFVWYVASAQQGNPEAQLNLAWMYENAVVVPRNQAQAMFLLTQAARAGYQQAREDRQLLHKRYDAESQRQRVRRVYSILIDSLKARRGIN